MTRSGWRFCLGCMSRCQLCNRHARQNHCQKPRPNIGATLSYLENRSSPSRLYYFTTLKHAVSNIQKKRLKISRLLELNDPFEFRHIRPSYKSIDVQIDRQTYLEELNNETGIICFARGYGSSLMWGHYAERAAGVALGFDVANHLQIPVKYDFNFLDYPSKVDEAFTEKCISTKAPAWSYEEEVRIGAHLHDSKYEFDAGVGRFLYFEPFSEGIKLREVLLGLNCKFDMADVQALKRQVADLVEICGTKRADDRFEIVKTNIL